MPASGREPVAPADATRSAGGSRLSAPTRDLVRRAAESPSRPLAPAERADLAGRTGHDLGRIRIHDSPEAATAASALDAAAWSFGPRIGFARPAQAPGPVRTRLLRHEAAHVSDYLTAPDPGTAGGPAPAWLADAEGPQEAAARRSAVGTAVTEGAPAPAMGPGVVHRAPAGSGATQSAPADESEVDMLAPGEPFRWIGSPASPTLAVRPSWLVEQGVPRNTPVIDGAEHATVMRPIIEALVAYCTWADRGRALANIGQTKLQIDPVSWKRDQTLIPVASSIYNVIGLPKDAPVQLVHQGDGVQVYVDLVRLAESSAAPGAEVAGGDGAAVDGSAVADAIIAALETEYGRPVAPNRRPALADYLEKDVPSTPEVYTERFPGTTLADMFGEAAYREVTEKNAGTTGQTGLLVRTRQGRTVAVDPSVSEEEIAVIRTMLDAARLQPAPPAPPTVEGEEPKAAPPSLLRRADVDALIALSKAKDKDAVLAALRKGGGAPDDRAKVADLIEAARAQLEWQAAAKSLDTSFDQGERERPIVPRPVRGVIRNPDRLVPGLEAQFTFETRDAVDAFRVPLVKIHWYARKAPGPGGQPGPVIEDDVTDYVEVSAHGVLNERIFEVTFPEKGIYEIHAFVDHNFYLPAHVTTQVEVTTEDAILAEFRAAGEPAWGAETSSKKHEFAEIEDDEQLLTSILLGPSAGAAMDTGYTEGTQAEGRLDPAVAARSALAGADRIAELSTERDRLDALAADYRAQGMPDDDVVLTSIEDRRDRVADAISDLEKLPTTGAGAAHVVPSRGFYASRTHGIPSAPLKLVAYFTVSGTGTDTTYHGHLLDQSELLESTHFHLERTADSFEGVMEALFVELSQVYPNGSVSFSYQVWDAAAQNFGDRFVRF
ncbi:MAG TPA: DUF4157 domain-containing protein, partial [Asanoa sp.]|nr:DUF4157 domain-containing protein [Asanoa sp.]